MRIIPCPSLSRERCRFRVARWGNTDAAGLLKIVPEIWILSLLASVEAECNVSERHVKDSLQSPALLLIKLNT